MRPVPTYIVSGTRALMLMVPNLQPRRSGIAVNNYFNCQGGIKECNCKDINTNKVWNKYGYNDIIWICKQDGGVGSVQESLDRIEESINRLKEFPNQGSIPRYSILKNKLIE